MDKKGKSILCLDFDGVLHSYTSGWQGPRTIPDPPVPGALQWLAAATNVFDVHIFSSRSRYLGGRRAMRRWLMKNLVGLAPSYADAPGWWRSLIAEVAFADPFQDEVRWAAKKLLRKIKFPKYKPPAFLTIDDRAFQFTGTFPDLRELQRFAPWYWKVSRCIEVDDDA